MWEQSTAKRRAARVRVFVFSKFKTGPQEEGASQTANGSETWGQQEGVQEKQSLLLHPKMAVGPLHLPPPPSRYSKIAVQMLISGVIPGSARVLGNMGLE